jgi:serine/threonine-protein kinase
MERGPKAGVLTTHRDSLPSTSQYELLLRIASGGMATVYVGRRSGAHGFSREVAIKRAHAHLMEEPSFSRMLVAEANLAAKIHHPNVVSVQAVEELEGELLLVMDYIEGASLSELLIAAQLEKELFPPAVAVRIVLDACAGLHAAHNAQDESGKLVGLVHRDISPHNLLIGLDGVSRVTDFGIAKASGQTESSGGRTATGTRKGKIGYMAPEYIERGVFDVRADVFALGVVAWEALTSQRLFREASEVETMRAVIAMRVRRPSEVAPHLGPALDPVIMRALARNPLQRYPSALAFADALETAARRVDLVATAAAVGDHVKAVAGAALTQRRVLIHQKAGGQQPVLRVVGRTDATATLATPPVAEDVSEHVTTDIVSVDPKTLSTGTVEPSFESPPSLRRGEVDTKRVLDRPSLRRSLVLLSVVAATIVAALIVLGLWSRGRSPDVPVAEPPSVVIAAPSIAPPTAPPPPPVPSSGARTEDDVVFVAESAAPPSAAPATPTSRVGAGTQSTTTPRARPRPITRPAAGPVGGAPERAPPNPYPE